MSSPKQPEFIFTSRLLFLVTRLHQIYKTFQDSLKTEFWPSTDTRGSWRKELTWLSQTSWPIHAVIEEAKEAGRDLDERNREFLRRVNSFLKASIGKDDSKTSSSEWFDAAISYLAQAMDQADSWEKFLLDHVALLRKNHIELGKIEDGVVYNKLWNIYPSLAIHPGRMGLLRLRESGFDRLKKAAKAQSSGTENTAEENDKNSCLASRQIFLTAHLIRYFYPDMWTKDEQREFLTLHQRISPLLRNNTAFKRSFDYRMEEVEGALMDKFQFLGQFQQSSQYVRSFANPHLKRRNDLAEK